VKAVEWPLVVKNYGGLQGTGSERPSLEPAFGLSIMGYCRNLAKQHEGHVKRKLKKTQ